MISAVRIRGLSVVGTMVLGMVSVACGQSVLSISPQAVLPGTTTNITLRGTKLGSATGLWMSFPGQTVLARGIKNNDENHVVFRLTVPANVPVGVYGIRVITAAGVSGMKLFCVDDLPTVAQKVGNTTPASAQPIAFPVAIDGTVRRPGRHYFRIRVRAGKRLSIEVLARRIGSPMDPLIRLLDAAGHELADSDDEPGLSGDAQLQYTFPHAGEYLIELRDISYRGGEHYFYRLRLGDFPCVTVPVPMSARRGRDVMLHFAGKHVAGLSPLRFHVPSHPLMKWVKIGVKRPGGQSSGFAVLAISDRDEFLEAEPNNTPRHANRVPLGTGLNGRLHVPGDEDRFVFAATKGQQFVFSAMTAAQGSPSDLLISLWSAQGNQVGMSDDFGIGNDSRLVYTFPAAGDYTLLVRDLNRRGGSAFAYHIAVEPYRPGFVLTASADRLVVPAGGTAAVTVTATRSGYNGPIAVSIPQLPSGMTNVPTVIGPGRSTAVLTVIATNKANVGSIFSLRIEGTAKIGTTDFRAGASIGPGLKESLAEMPYPPRVLLNSLAVAAGPSAPFSLRTEPAQLAFGRNLSASVKIIATRQKGFDGAITFAVTPKKKGLPSGVSVAIQPIPQGKDEIQLVFSASGKASLGEFTAGLMATQKQGGTTRLQPVPGIGLTIAAPYQLFVPTGPLRLKVGGQLKIKVTVRRNPAFAAPIVLEFGNLPKGVTATKATIPMGKNEVDVVLSAGKNVVQGIAKNIALTGKAVVKNVKFSEKSPALSLDVR